MRKLMLFLSLALATAQPQLPTLDRLLPSGLLNPERLTRQVIGQVVTNAQIPLADRYLSRGELEAGRVALESRLATHPDDDEARFGLGVLQFVAAIEETIQSWHRFGLNPELGQSLGIPLLRLPTPYNPEPETISYDDFRAILERWLSNLAETEATLAGITDPDVVLTVRFSEIRLDLDGDGTATEEERLWNIYTLFNTQAEGIAFSEDSFALPPDVTIDFDLADAHWLRGYTHLLRAFAEMSLAYDSRDLFERTAHLFFPQVETPHTILQGGDDLDISGFDVRVVADVITMLHLMRFELAEPERLTRVLGHLENTIAQSRLMWAAALAETDDSREWIPNPQQTSVVPVEVTEEMVAAWEMFLTEAELILAGEQLIPHWRTGASEGINLRRVFTEPRPFDLILWLQGSGATAYLESGTLTQEATWRQLQDVFRGNFIGFAIWFN